MLRELQSERQHPLYMMLDSGYAAKPQRNCWQFVAQCGLMEKNVGEQSFANERSNSRSYTKRAS